MASLPTPIRATLGLLATALDAVQELVDHAPEIPMEAVGNSMQLSLRLQQHYVALLTRGDEFLASLRGAPEEPPAWATFDEPPPSSSEAGVSTDSQPSTEDEPSIEDELSQQERSADAVDDLPEAEIPDGLRHAGQGDPLLAAATRGRPPAASSDTAAGKAPAKKAGAKAAAKTPGPKPPGKRTPAKKSAGVKAASVKSGAAKRTPAKKTPAVKAAAVQAGAASRVAKSTTGPALDSASPILAPATAPPKRGRPAKKAGPRKASAAPQLDANLTAGAAPARPQSAFDLAEPPLDAGLASVDLVPPPATAGTNDGAGQPLLDTP
jgi:hypothetical protein